MIEVGTTDARVPEVVAVPLVGVLAADPGEVRTGALRSPLEGVVVHALGGEREVPVALDLVAHRADHLAVAEVAALADVDVAARELERRVGPHALDILDRALEVEERHDLDRPPIATTIRMPRMRSDRVLLEELVLFQRPVLAIAMMRVSARQAGRPRRRHRPAQGWR